MLNISFFQREERLMPANIWISAGLKRPYNADYKRFQTCFTPQNIVTQIIKGACLPLLHVTKEMEQFNKEKWEALKKRRAGDDDEEFDLQASIKKHLPLFFSSTQRFFITSIIRKGYDLYAFLNFSAKLSDRLCKDIGKSAIRKVTKYGRLNGASRMLRTLCYGNLLNYVSSLSYDVLLALHGWMVSKKSSIDVSATLSWLSTKCLFYCILLSSSTVGYCAGTLLGDKSQVISGLLSILTEAVAADWATRVLHL